MLQGRARVLVFAALLGVPRCEARSRATPGADTVEKEALLSSLKLGSPAFENQGRIPAKYTCEGSDTSPPLTWSGAPRGTKSFALIVDDPDAPDPKAPKRTWVHWVLSDLPPGTTELAEGASPSGLPPGAVSGKNDWGKTVYGGPCPPIGRHRYFHKLYALDTLLGLESPTKAELETAMTGHVLGKAELVGTYQKGQ